MKPLPIIKFPPIDISKANSVKIYIYGKNNWIFGQFSKNNITRYKDFVDNYIYEFADDKPDTLDQANHGRFINIASGSDNEIWLAHFFQSDLMKNKFIGVGFGFTNTMGSTEFVN